MRREINAAFTRFREDDDAWVAIVTGAGRAFCAGADLRSETGNPAGDFPGTFWERPTVNSFESGWEIFKPVIAAVNGLLPRLRPHAAHLVRLRDRQRAGRVRLPGGAARRADDRRARSGCRRRSTGSTRWSCCSPASGSTRPGRSEIGLAGWVVPHDELMDEARALAARLLRAAPLAPRAIKEMAVRGPGLSTVDAIRFGETMRRVAGATEDAAEGGRRAERRDPVWRAR